MERKDKTKAQRLYWMEIWFISCTVVFITMCKKRKKMNAHTHTHVLVLTHKTKQTKHVHVYLLLAK